MQTQQGFGSLGTLFLGLALQFGCSTTINQPATIDLSKTAVGTYALFSFAIEGMSSQQTRCKLVINQKGSTPKQIHTYAFPSGSWGLIPLSAGTYSYDHIDCGFGRRYLVTNPFGKKQNEFSLLPGKINYLGHTTLSFDSKDDLKLRYDQKDHLEQIKRVFTNLPATSWAATNTVSAYTQRNIRPDMMSFELPRAYSIKSRAPKEEQEKLKGLLAMVQSKIGKCAETEAISNPLKIGAFKTVYSLKDGKFIENEKRESHVYSKAFVMCVQKSMASITYSADYQVDFDMAL
jgi:hypothetical protein